MLSTIAGLMFKIFFLLLVGFVMRKAGVITAEDKKTMTKVLMSIVVFFMIIMSSQNELSFEAAKAIGITSAATAIMFLICIPILHFIAFKILKMPVKEGKIFVNMSVFMNVTFMGYPILQELYGSVGLLCAIMASMVYNIIFYTWGIAYLKGDGSISLKSIFTNKIAICSVIAVVMYFLQIKVPEPFAGTFNAIGSMTTPLSMMITGCTLAESDLFEVIKNKRLYQISLTRMIIIPALVFGIMKLLGFEALPLAVCTLIMALPAGTMTGIVATEYDCAPEFAAQGIVQTMIIMIVTFPIWAFIVSL